MNLGLIYFVGFLQILVIIGYNISSKIYRYEKPNNAIFFGPTIIYVSDVKDGKTLRIYCKVKRLTIILEVIKPEYLKI